MKVLFVVVKTIEPSERYYPSAGICYVAAAAKQAGHQTFGLNLSWVEDQQQALVEAIADNGIEVVCISGLSKDYNDVEFITNSCKLAKPGIQVIVGGHLVSTEPELVVQNLAFDYGVIGPGEETIVELLAVLSQPSDEKLRKIRGLAYKREDGAVVITEARSEVAELDSLPYPDFPLLYDAVIRECSTIFITASRGCPHKCTFCSRSNSARRYQQRSLDAIFAELDYWLRHYDLKAFAILDDLFAATPGRLREFCERVKKYGLTFAFQSRVDIMTEDLFAMLKDAGCNTISFGLESINNGILKSMQKRITADQVDRAVQLTKKYDMRLVGNFIFGDVEETWETANESLNYWIANEAKTDIYLTPICLHPGTKLYEIACKRGIIKDKLQFLKDGCPLLNISRMSDDEVKRLHKRIEHLLSIKDRPLDFSIINLRPDNCVDLEVECMSCKRKHVICLDLASNTRYGFVCPDCRQKIKVVPEDFFKPVVYKQALDEFAEKYFRKFADEHKRIAIWGAKQRAQLLLMSSPSLRQCTAKVVDSAFRDHKEKFLGLFEVEPPEALRGCKIDHLLIASVRFKPAIIHALRDQLHLDLDVLDV